MTYTAKNIADGKATVARTPLGTRQRCTEVQSAYPTATMVWGDGPTGHHAEGRALDFMVGSNRALGDQIATYLWTHRVRFKVEYIIWYQRILSTVKSPGVWRAMEDRGSSTQNHKDHVHVSFTTSANLAPKPSPVTPAPATLYSYSSFPLPRGHYFFRFNADNPKVHSGTQSAADRAHIAKWQTAMNYWQKTALVVDGVFGPASQRAAVALQQKRRWRYDGGLVGPQLWNAAWGK